MDISALIDEQYGQFKQASEQAERAKAQDKDDRRKQTIDAFRAALESDFGAEIIAEIDVEIVIPNQSTEPQGRFTYDGLTWKLTRENVRQAGMCWRILGREEDFKSPFYDVNVAFAEAQAALLIGLGKGKEVAEAIRQADIERARIDEENRQRNARVRAESAAIFAAAEQVDAEIRAEIARKTAAAEQTMWHWPAPYMVTYYWMTWCDGAVYDGGELTVGKDYGYTTTDTLDAQGYITVYNQYRDPRTVKLDMVAHKPVWERRLASRIGDLPNDLLKPLDVLIENYDVEWFAGGDAIGRHFFTHKTGERRVERVKENAYPVEWVRALVDGGVR